MSHSEDGLVHDWDRSDPAEWAPTTAPIIPAVRYLPLVLALILILGGGTIGVLGSVPGAWNGATLLALIMLAAAITIVIREVRRG